MSHNEANTKGINTDDRSYKLSYMDEFYFMAPHGMNLDLPKPARIGFYTSLEQLSLM